MNLIDDFIGYISPQRGFKRAQYRAAIDSLRKYEAASGGRRTEGWATTNTSVNTDNLIALDKLRARSRDLVQNNPFANIAVKVIAINTVGTGIKPTPRVEEVAKKRIMASWSQWAETKECDYDGQLNFYGLQKLVMRTVAESGEAFILKRRTKSKGDIPPIKLQVLESEFIDVTKDTTVLKDGNYIMQGVEFNGKGERVAYYIYNRHPDETTTLSLESKRISADQVIHVFEKSRAGQVRGVPFGVSAMMRLKDFDDYEDAQLMRQKIAACFSVFIQDANSPIVSDTSSSLPERVEPGIIETLPAGKTVAFASPPPAEGYDEYSRRILQAIAVGYGVTYEAMTGDLTNVNFSSGRMGWLEFQRRITDWQFNLLIPSFCDGAWNWFIEGMSLSQGTAKNMLVDWTPPRREMIQPVEEVKAMSEMVRNGFQSWQEAVREWGYDPTTVLKELSEDAKNFDKEGLKPSCDPRFDTNRNVDNEEDKTKEKTDKLKK